MFSIIPMQRTMQRTPTGVDYMLTLSKKDLPADYDYWPYHILVEREDRKNIGFRMMATKKSLSEEWCADHLAMTLAIDNVRHLLDEAGTDESKPIIYRSLGSKVG